MRQTTTKKKTLRKLSVAAGLEVVSAMARGGTDHGRLLTADDGSKWWLAKDGAVEPYDNSPPAEVRREIRQANGWGN
jgi:hypothetical protein